MPRVDLFKILVIRFASKSNSKVNELTETLSEAPRRGISGLFALMILALSSMPLAALAQDRKAELSVYKGAGCEGSARIAGFERWLVRPIDRVVDFLARDTWRSMVSSGKWISDCWKTTRYKVSLAIPMLPSDRQSNLEEGAGGAYNSYFRELAEAFVSNGQGDAILRLGWEFNGGWYPWAAQRNPEAWVALWKQIVTTMRAVPGARFKFDWSPTLGWQQVRSDKVYPGDDYVDIIGLDVYNQTWNSKATTPEARWGDLMDQSYGLKWHAEFARKHGKCMSFPEWGTGTRPDGHGGGDDPLFVRNMAAWISSHNVCYHGIWDYPASDFNAEVSKGNLPGAGKEIREKFGKLQ